MRAVYLENFDDGRKVYVEGDDARHLIKVVRIMRGEKILILNGQGVIAQGVVSVVGKKNVEIEIEEIKQHEKNPFLSLAFCVPKKEAVNDIVRLSVEVGVSSLLPVISEYSQQSFKMTERLMRVVTSALVQSNNPYKLDVNETCSFVDLVEHCSQYDTVVYFSSNQSLCSDKKLDIKNAKSCLMIIGPEGGLSPEEEDRLKALSNVSIIHISTPIMRSPTAVAVGAGYIYGLKSD